MNLNVQLHVLQGKSPGDPLDRRLSGSQSLDVDKRQKISVLAENRTLIPRVSRPQPVTMPHELLCQHLIVGYEGVESSLVTERMRLRLLHVIYSNCGHLLK
jgi:hypothetical protein